MKKGFIWLGVVVGLVCAGCMSPGAAFKVGQSAGASLEREIVATVNGSGYVGDGSQSGGHNVESFLERQRQEQQAALASSRSWTI